MWLRRERAQQLRHLRRSPPTENYSATEAYVISPSFFILNTAGVQLKVII
jgi:hypothetical protein